MPRLFIALDFVDSVTDQLCTLPGDLPVATWVDPDSLHLTLRFIGEVSQNRLIEIRESLHRVRQTSFFISLVGLGLFPLRGDPETLWMGVESPDNGLTQLRHRIDRALAHAQIGPEGRKFHPHVTLAGVKNCQPRWLGHYLAENGLKKIEGIAVEQFVLYSSQRSPGGAVYYEEERFALSGVLTEEDRETLDDDEINDLTDN